MKKEDILRLVEQKYSVLLKEQGYDIENIESIIYNSMLVPRFKIIEEEDFGTIIEKSKYDEIELNW